MIAISVPQVLPTATYSYFLSENGSVEGPYYWVLCGNVVFASGGNARYWGPVPFPSPSSTPPPLVFFRDAGGLDAQLTENLPGTYPHPCPAPAAPTGNYLNWVLNAAGQTVWAYWLSQTATMAMTSSNTSVVTVSPSTAPVDTAAPGYPPSPGTYYVITAVGAGTAVINNVNSADGSTPGPIVVTVRATPSPAPVPTPMSNALSPTPSPSPGTSASPSPSPSPRESKR